MKVNSWIFLLAIVVTSCNSNIVFDDYNSFENQSWNADSSVIFNFSITDTTVLNQLVVKVRHTIDYEFQNLFLFVKAEELDTLEILLSNKEGKWLGSGISDIREVEFICEDCPNFDKKGNYTIEIEQAMRYGKLNKIQNLNNISAIGISIQRQDE